MIKNIQYKQAVKKVIDNCKLTEIQRRRFYLFCGIEGKRYRFSQIAKLEGHSASTVRQTILTTSRLLVKRLTNEQIIEIREIIKNVTKGDDNSAE